MKDLLILLAHLLTAIARLPGPGGTKTIVADSLLMIISRVESAFSALPVFMMVLHEYMESF